MKKNFKKFISLLLSLLMLMSMMAVGAGAADADTVDGPEEDRDTRYMFQVIADFFIEIYNFFKYIFYDMLRGVPA